MCLIPAHANTGLFHGFLSVRHTYREWLFHNGPFFFETWPFQTSFQIR